MKKLLFIFAIIISTVSCDLLNELEECEKILEKETWTTYGVDVYDKQHSRISGIDVKLETWKVHCDGHIGKPPGDVLTGVTELGFFGPPIRFGYKFNTLEDKVHFKATISKNGTVIEIDEAIYTYNMLPPKDFNFKFYIDSKWR